MPKYCCWLCSQARCYQISSDEVLASAKTALNCLKCTRCLFFGSVWSTLDYSCVSIFLGYQNVKLCTLHLFHLYLKRPPKVSFEQLRRQRPSLTPSQPPGAAAERTSNLDIKADAELRGSGFLCYLCSLDYGTLCFLPSDRDTLIPHGRPLSTAWSSAECHWHRSLSNRSKSSIPATGRPLRRQPQPRQAKKGGEGWQTEMGGDIQITRVSLG